MGIKCVQCNDEVDSRSVFCHPCAYTLREDQRVSIFQLNKITDSIQELKERIDSFEEYLLLKRNARTVKKSREVTKQQRDFVFKRDGFVCGNCKKKLPREFLQIDHVIPQAKGGKTYPDNLQVLCRECNFIKRDEEFKAKAKV